MPTCAGSVQVVQTSMTCPNGRLRDSWWGYELIPLGAINQADDANAPLREATTWQEIEAHPEWPDSSDPRVVRGKADEALALREAGYAVVANPAVGCLIFHHYQRLRGFDTFMIDMYYEPALFKALCERILSIDVAIMERFLPAVADSTDVVFMADDLGSQMGMLMGPDLYREFLKPFQARWIMEARRLAPGARIAYHSCGSFAEVVPDLIEIGVDVLTPIQPLAVGMELEWLKREYGSELAFMGGMDTQKLLPKGDERDVRRGARTLIDTMAPGGGFIFSASHELLPDVPPRTSWPCSMRLRRTVGIRLGRPARVALLLRRYTRHAGKLLGSTARRASGCGVRRKLISGEPAWSP